MTKLSVSTFAAITALFPITFALAGCTGTASESKATSVASASDDFAITEHGTFEQPWAAAFIPGTQMLFVTERAGTAKITDTSRQGSAPISVTGLPTVDYGGQGGLGDVAFLKSESAATLSPRTIYLSWAEAGPNDTRGAVVGRGKLVCSAADTCAVEQMNVIWRQPKVTGRGHYSHRLAISPDEQHLFVASGDRQKMQPAQDTTNNLGSVVKLTLDGSPAGDNPFAGKAGQAADIWSYGHRNILGLAFDSRGRLWDLEHGPKGGDELNQVTKGSNYGWPLVSDGDHYDGRAIPRHASTSAYTAPAISWTPVIAPGDFIFYSGKQFKSWREQAIIAAMDPTALVRVEIVGDSAREVERIPMDKRIREIAEGSDGSVWLLEDGAGGRLLKLSAVSRSSQ